MREYHPHQFITISQCKFDEENGCVLPELVLLTPIAPPTFSFAVHRPTRRSLAVLALRVALFTFYDKVLCFSTLQDSVSRSPRLSPALHGQPHALSGLSRLSEYFAAEMFSILSTYRRILRQSKKTLRIPHSCNFTVAHSIREAPSMEDGPVVRVH